MEEQPVRIYRIQELGADYRPDLDLRSGGEGGARQSLLRHFWPGDRSGLSMVEWIVEIGDRRCFKVSGQRARSSAGGGHRQGMPDLTSESGSPYVLGGEIGG